MKRYALATLLGIVCAITALAAGPFGFFGPRRTITIDVQKNCPDGKCQAAPQEVRLLGRSKVFAPKAGHFVHFTHRDLMKAGHPTKRASLHRFAKVPATPLPVDASANRTVVCPMYANDQYGDCGEAMAAHTLGILSFGQGKRPELLFTDQVLINQYLQVSGGDNGMDETMEVGPSGVFTVGVGGNKQAIAVSSLDVDPNDVALVHYCLDQFYCLNLAWSVPDEFINGWQSGSSFLQPMTPNPNNGHYVTICDCSAEGSYTLYTWGGYSIVSQSFVASVQPSYFVVFSPLQFDPATGLDSKNRHITTQAAVWNAVSGETIPAAVISAFPPAKGPTPGPVPTPPGPTPTPTPPPVTFTVTIPPQTIPAQSVTFRGFLGRSYTAIVPAYTLPAQTVTGTVALPIKSDAKCCTVMQSAAKCGQFCQCSNDNLGCNCTIFNGAKAACRCEDCSCSSNLTSVKK
jgi:hypothetical protein